jgi:hypothetical protein
VVYVHHHHVTQSSHSINAIGPAPLWSGRKREHCSITVVYVVMFLLCNACKAQGARALAQPLRDLSFFSDVTCLRRPAWVLTPNSQRMIHAPAEFLLRHSFAFCIDSALD